MKVFFDGSIFGQQKIGGISRVGFELIREMSKNKNVEQIFYRGFYMDSYPFEKKWFNKYYGLRKLSFCKCRVLNFLDNVIMNIVYKLNATPDLIFHSLYYRMPKNRKGPVVVHAYDMIQELFGGSVKTIKFKEKALKGADLIISISESTKRDLCKMYSISSEKVVVVYPGVSDLFFVDHNSAKLKNKRPYILYVGARNPKYKNFDILLDVFISQKYFNNFDLILVGGEKEITDKQKEKIRNSSGGGKWLLQEFCSDEKLAELYSNAVVFIYPSLYEGFGIPPLEAMASGCPVVASNASSIPESVGDAGLMFDPASQEDLIKQIEKVINDKSMVATLVERGKIRAKKFSWGAMAGEIYHGYQKLL